MQAHLITAPGDGVGPAVLLSLPGAGAASGRASGPSTQYLFNVPEGFARLVLEHKIRPGSGLRAAFACDAAALSGFGGLVMRLRGEGHEQLHVVGPAGCQAAVSSLRHFINWKHPAVLLEEASPWERSSVVFQDDRIAVAAIWKPPLLDASWNAPQWMVHAQLPATAAKEGGSTSSASSSSGCSSESSGSERASGASESDSSSDDSSSSEVSDAGDSSGSDSSAESSDEEAGQQAGQRPAAALPGVAPGGGSAARGAEGVFDALDELLMSGRGGRRLALAHLKAATASQAEAPGSVPRGSGGTGQSSGTAAGGAGAAAAPAARAEQTAERAALAAATAARSAVANGAPSRRRQGAAGGAAAAAGGAEASDVVVLGGKRYQRLPEKAGINLWVCHKLTSLAAGSPAVGEAVGRGTPAGRGNASLGPPPQQEQQQQQQVLGFLCHLKATDQLLLLTNVHSKAAATQLAQHPALALLLQQPERAAGVLHLAAPGVAGSAALRQLCQQLRPLAAAAGGQQLLLEQPGPHGSSQVIGHVAAARTTAKLNLISSRIFPLPAGVRPPSGAPRQGAPPAFATADGTAPAAANGSPAACSSGDIVVEQVQLDCEHQSEGEDGQEDKQRHQQRQAEQQQQQQQQQQREPRDRSVSAGSKRPSCGDERTSGILIVRNVSVASWEAMGSPVVDQQAGQGPDGAGQNCEPAVPGAAVAVPARPGGSAGAPLGEQAQLVVEPVESFAAATLACGGRFDAAAVQAEVQQERPQLLVQLELLQGQQEQGMLPGPEQLAAAANQTAAQRWCAQNRVAPPPPPPLPSPAAVAPFEQLANQQRSVQQLGAPAHQQFANVPLLWQQPAVVHQQYWHAQHQPPAWHPQWLLPAGTPSPLPGAAMMLPHPAPQQWHGAQPVMAAAPFVATAALQGAPPRHQPAPPPPARAPPGPPPAEPEQQAAAAEPAASNKRAADGLRARLQGGKRSRQQQASSDAPAAAAQRPEGAEQQEQQQAGKQPDLAERHGGRDQRLPAWLENVPAGLLQLGAGASGRAGPEVLFLGTGSAEPSKYRGASAIQLRLSCGQSILMDCGEGTLGALCRAHGTAAAQRHVASLGCVWVSHRHADHMSGVLPLLAAYPASLPPLLLVGPRSLRDWLAEAAPPLGLAGRYRFVHCLELNQPGHWARHALQRHLGISHLHCVPVRHCSDAYGLVLRHEEGWSMVYSGDTQPSQQLVQAGAGCTLLIHEATFEPCLEQQARQKRHSTTAEALDVAQRMGAYRCILTHFSQRYPKWPEGVGQAPRAEGNAPTDSVSPTQIAPAMAAVAFDGMRVPLELLPVLPALMPAVQAALAAVEEEEELEEGEKPDGAA